MTLKATNLKPVWCLLVSLGEQVHFSILPVATINDNFQRISIESEPSLYYTADNDNRESFRAGYS